MTFTDFVTILEVMTSPRRRWTPETIIATLEPIVAELGRFPKPKELAERGLSGLTSAMGRHGGVAAWRERVTADTPAVTHEEIEHRAYLKSLEPGGDDPFANWVEAERELASTR
jgi:hypothetical protein